MRILRDFIQTLRDYGLEKYNRYYSVYAATVIDNRDPEHRGRLRLQIPVVHGSSNSQIFAPAMGIPNGNGMGLYAIPTIGSRVWAQFENGDPSYPVWSYGPLAQALPDTNRAEPNLYLLITPAGHRMYLDDQNGELSLLHASGTGIEVRNGQVIVGRPGGQAQPAVLGNQLEAILGQLLDQIVLITVPTPSGPSGPPTNAPAFQAIRANLAAIKAQTAQVN
jgi:hypothetical protein